MERGAVSRGARRAAAPARIRWSAPSSCRPTASSSGRDFTSAPAKPHAEVHALAEAGARARGATLYCTLEPCCHQGRTGPCVSRIVDAGIARVVAAVEDPNPAVRGRGFAFLRERGVTVDVGLAAESAVALNQPFFTLMREGRPFVVLKAATSLDGRIAEAPGRRTLPDVGRGQPPCASGPRRSRRDRRRQRHDPRRRSRADGARRLPRAAARARRVRPPPADAAAARACSRHPTPGLSSS